MIKMNQLPGHPVFRFVFLVISLSLLATCTLDTEYFKEYKDLNLLGNMPFGGSWPDGTPYWQTLTDKDPTAAVNDPYMNWQSVPAAAPPADSPAGSPVYRLEIKNLFPNGDFTAPLDTALWVGVDSVTDGSLFLGKSNITVEGGLSTYPGDFFLPLDVGNYSLWMTLRDNDSVTVNLSNLVPDTNTQYLLRYRFRSYGNHSLTLNGTEHTISFLETGQGSEDLHMVQAYYIPTEKETPSAFLVPATGTTSLSFDGSKVSIQNLALDDVQLVNVDNNSAVALNVPRITDTVKPLLQGSLYTFSLAVKDEDPADLSPLTANVYPAGALTVTLNYIDNSGTLKFVKFPTVQRPLTGWTTWTRLTFDLSLVNTLNFPLSYNPGAGDPPVFQITLSPTDGKNLTSQHCGRLLISDPRFIFREKK